MLKKEVIRRLHAIAITLILIETSKIINPIAFLIISSFRKISLLPIAFIAFRFAV